LDDALDEEIDGDPVHSTGQNKSKTPEVAFILDPALV
jgi:hypothetical protein